MACLNLCITSLKKAASIPKIEKDTSHRYLSDILKAASNLDKGEESLILAEEIN